MVNGLVDVFGGNERTGMLGISQREMYVCMCVCVCVCVCVLCGILTEC